jgi:uncharacterized tellurite resistance protein B-like protein
MFQKLYDDIVSHISAEDIEADRRDAAIRLATAVLMVDVAVVDSAFDEVEFDRMVNLVRDHFGLGADDAATLINAANAESDDLVSVRQLTAFLDEQLSGDDKGRVVELLWSIAYADGQLDRYENSLVLKISDLLHVDRDRVTRLKNDAATAAAV